jgi:hypothetical protein
MPSDVTSQLSRIGHDKHLAALDGVTIAVACLPLIIRTGITVPISPRVRDFLPKGKKALGLLRRLTGQMGLSPVTYLKLMTASVQSVAIFGSELW